MGEGSLSQEDIDALLGGFGGGGGSKSSSGMDDLDALVGGGDSSGPSFADIAAALGPSATPAPAKSSGKSSGGGGGGGSSANTSNLNLLLDVTLQLTIELGRTTMFIKDVLQLTEGTVVELDKNVGEELDILANAKLVGRGKLIVLDDYYGIQITQIIDPKDWLGGTPAFM